MLVITLLFAEYTYSESSQEKQKRRTLFKTFFCEKDVKKKKNIFSLNVFTINAHVIKYNLASLILYSRVKRIYTRKNYIHKERKH